VTQPGFGTLNLAANGSFTYTPAAGFTGTDTFTYQVTDGDGGVDTAVVTIEVKTPATAALSGLDIAGQGSGATISEGADEAVSVGVENAGGRPGSFDVTLDLGGVSETQTTPVLTPGSVGTVTFDGVTGSLTPGEYEVTVSTPHDATNGTLVVEAPAAFAVSITDTNTPVAAGDTLSVSALVENTGDVTGTQPISLEIPGFGENATEVTLAGGESTTATLSLPTTGSDAGSYTATVGSDNNSESVAVTVLEPAAFEVSITETNSPVLVDEMLTVQAEIENTGGTSATQTVGLVVGDTERNTTQVSLAGGESTTVSLTWTTAERGTHAVSVGSADTQAQTAVWVGANESDLGPPAVVGETPPQDLDGDGVYQDLNGDGTVSLADVQLLVEYRTDFLLQDHAEFFDADGDGSLTLADVQALYQAYLAQT